MPDENTVGTAAPVDNSPSLLSVVGEMYGDYSDAEPETDAGTPPASAPDTPASSEGDAPSAPAGDPPAVADATGDPDPSTLATSTDPDPLEGSAPLGYVVNGEQRTYDGVTVLKDGGAIIDPEKVADIQRKLGERDHLFETSQAQYQKLTALEKLTEWNQTGADGKVHTLTGHAAVEASRLALGSALAENTTLRTIFQRDPRELVGVDETGKVVWNPDAIKGLDKEASLLSRELSLSVKARLASSAQPPAASVPASSAPPDFAKLAPAMVTLAAQSAGVATLSEQSKAILASVAPKYGRIATPDDVKLNPTLTVGEPVIDAAFVALVKQMVATQAEQAKTVQSVTEAAKNNAAKLAAASVGKGSKQAPKITPQKEPEPTRSDDFDDAWDRREKAASNALRAAHAVR